MARNGHETSAWIFPAARYAEALAFKERIGGVMQRETLEWGVVYVVRPIPRRNEDAAI